MSTDHHVTLTPEERAELDARAAADRRAEIADVVARHKAAKPLTTTATVSTTTAYLQPRWWYATLVAHALAALVTVLTYSSGAGTVGCIVAGVVAGVLAWPLFQWFPWLVDEWRYRRSGR